ncbi:HEAT repeat domain-containing protein [Candidatus Aerophobetes bacterium]|nr:HEAT repeat domain-containing protein [Candidatus Aerophobetes bacterium]
MPHKKPVDVTTHKIQAFIKSFIKSTKILLFYPETNPMCKVAIDECLELLRELKTENEITITVTPKALLVKERPIDMNYPGIVQFTQRLYVLGVEKLTFQQNVTSRELRSLCEIFGMHPKKITQHKGVSSIFKEKGIEHIQLVESRVPEIVEIKDAEKFLADVIMRTKRQMQHSLDQRQVMEKSIFLRPRVVIKVDADLDLSSLSGDEMEELISDYEQLGQVIREIQKKETERWAHFFGQKLREMQQFLQITEGRPKSQVWDRIAHSIIGMDPQIKEDLVGSCLIPALLGGREEGEILRFFPDAALAHSLALLCESGIFLPRAFAQTIENLHLPERRESILIPILGSKLQKNGHRIDNIPALQERKNTVEKEVMERQKLRISENELSSGINLNYFQNLDIILDNREKEALKQLASKMADVDLVASELRCLVNLISLEEDLETCRSFVERVSNLLTQLINSEHWEELTFWLTKLRVLNGIAWEKKFLASTLIEDMLSSLASGGIVQRLVDMYHQEKDDRRGEKYLSVLGALGDFVIPVFIQLLDSEEHRSVRRTMMNIMVKLAPSYDINRFASYMNQRHWYVVRNIVWLLGQLGPGNENIIARALSYGHHKVKKEAIRSLASIGSQVAIEQIIFLLGSEDHMISRTAAEHLLYLPGKVLEPHLIKLLSRSDFLQKDVFITLQLVEIAGKIQGKELLELLHRLSWLRFFFWNWKLLRIGLKAYRTLKKIPEERKNGKI